MDSLLLAFALGLVVWLLMRRVVQHRTRQRTDRQTAGPDTSGAGAAEPTAQKVMPRFGVPGSVTRAQMTQLRDCHFEPSRHWSREEAQLILDTVTYLRAVIAQQTGDDDPPIEIQNQVLKFILVDEELRTTVHDWSLNRTREDEERAGIALPRDETYARVSAFITELWDTMTEDG